MVICPCPVLPGLLFTEGRAIAWQTSGLQCQYGWRSLELSSAQPAQQYVAGLIVDPWKSGTCLADFWSFCDLCGLIWTLGISRSVEWEPMAYWFLQPLSSGKQAPIWISSLCLAYYCTYSDSTDCWCESWEPEKPLAGAKFHIWVFRLAPKGEKNGWNPTASPIMRS